MSLSPGTRLGPYVILAPLGAGGMGEVYRARDTRLGRGVAIKVLPQSVAATPEDRARFSREAKTISSLNHAHICVLHDVGREGDTDYLVMELIEGETLSRRISRGALPSAEVLRIGTQIADALDRAHRAGVIHRDLKPGNVMLTKSGAKLMDFGLARPPRSMPDSRVTAAATVTEGAPAAEEPITAAGAVVGTIQYMAPEQLEGKAADARSDLWALGCVLYEMTTGRRAFEGSTSASIISSILRDHPREMTELSPLMPPALEQLVKACLAKDPEDRVQTAHDARLQLAWITESGSKAAIAARPSGGRIRRERIGWAFVAVAAVALTFLLAPKNRPGKPVVFQMLPPKQVHSVDLPSISPDGTTLAFHATDSTAIPSIWIRRMTSLEARRIPGTEGASRPFWSPDSRNLAFFAAGKLMKVDIAGGPPVALCDSRWGNDGSWSRRGVILFDQAAADDSIQVVPAAGGTPRGATHRAGAMETGTAWPHFLPDGTHFLYVAYHAESDSGTLMVGSLDSKDTKALGPVDSKVLYSSGHLLYVNGGVLVARPFDTRSLRFTGEPVAVARNVGADPAGGAQFSISMDGTLVYYADPLAAGERMVWLDRRGERVGVVGPIGHYGSPALSRDETKLAVLVTDFARRNSAIWVWDLVRDLGTRLTMSSRATLAPVWSPDGSRVVYGRENGGPFDLFLQPVGAARAESLLYASPEVKTAVDWSPDGRWVLFLGTPREGPSDDMSVFAVSANDAKTRIPVAASRFREVACSVSYDGRWIAYASNESGEREIYVQRFMSGGEKWRISTRGGVQPTWRGDGRELYYIAADGTLMYVSVQPASPPRFSAPKRLFKIPGRLRFDTRNQYLPSRDGSRFLAVAPEDESPAGTTTVVLHWPALARGTVGN